MKKITCTLSTFLLIVTSSLFAQDWVKMMGKPNANLHDIQNAFYKWNAQRTVDSNKQDISGRDEEEQEGNYELFKRWEWYMEPRTYPTGNLPTSNYTADNYAQYKAQKLANERISQTQSITPKWSYAGNANVPTGGGAGRVNRICFYPGNDSILFACTPFGGLWKSTNAGATWKTNTDQLKSIATSDLAINPLKPNVMYLATGDGDGWDQPTIGVLKSYDGGNTWDTTGLYDSLQHSGPYYVIGTRVLINPADTSLILTGTTNGLYLSTNSGLTWTQTLSTNVKSVEFEPFHSSTVYVGTYDGQFFRSLDSGFTFVKDSIGLPNVNIGRVTVGVSPADSNVVYLLEEKSSTSGFYGLYLSTDRGQTFTTRATLAGGAPNLLGWSALGTDTTGQGWYTLSLAVSPTNVDTVMVGGVNVWASSDSGKIWHLAADWTGASAPYVHADIHELTFLPGSGSAYYATCDGGIFTRKANSAVAWTDISHNLQIGQQYSIGLSAITPGLWLTGWQDNGTNSSGGPWKQVIGGDGMVCFIDYTDDNTMFGSYQNGALEYSTDGGHGWASATGGINETGPWTTRWLQDPVDPNIIYSGFKNIWLSSDYGINWGAISTWGSSTISALAVSPSNDLYIYAAQGNSIYGTYNGGGSWSNITAGLPAGLVSITAIAVDASNPLHVWVTFSGWLANGKVYESFNGGASWHNISAGIPNLPVNCIVEQEGGPRGIYIGTDIGVYYKDTTLSSWIDYSNGLPNVQVDDLKIYAPTNSLIAATYGRGTWQIPTYYALGIDEVTIDKSIRIYPNPTSGKATIQFDVTSGNYTLSVLNMLGQTVMADKINLNGQSSYSIDMSGFEKGMYFVKISNGPAQTVKKLVVY